MDGFNTELSERLHIDFAKQGYHAGNHWDYIAHMMTWLHRQEAVYLRRSFLVWLEAQDRNDSGPETTSDDPADSHLEDPDDAEDESESEEDSFMASTGVTYRIANKCPYPSCSIDYLNTAHFATPFLATVRAFVRAHFPRSHFVPTRLTTFNLYKQIWVLQPWNKFIADAVQYHRIRATPAVQPKGRKWLVPPHFDVALIIKNWQLFKLSGENCLSGMSNIP